MLNRSVDDAVEFLDRYPNYYIAVFPTPVPPDVMDLIQYDYMGYVGNEFVLWLSNKSDLDAIRLVYNDIK